MHDTNLAFQKGENVRFKRIAAGVLASAGMAVAGIFCVAAPAQAVTTVGVYVSFPTWLGNCPQGGKVTAIQAYTDYSYTNWDAGDDIVWLRMQPGVRNKVIANLYCTKWPGGYYQTVANYNVVPTRNYQTLWVGTGSWTRN